MDGNPAATSDGLRFDRRVARDGYTWWYVDALSDDGANAITIIAFIGSVFSPYYKWARRRGPADAENFCALNVALYGRARRWAMTERGRAGMLRTADMLAIGPSALLWDGTALTVQIDEISNPLPRRLRGTVRVYPAALTGRCFALDAPGRHRWSPLAPVSRVEVELQSPALRWSGAGYFDMNAGDAPLERDFLRWDWCCARTATGAAALYDVTPRAGAKTCLGLSFDRAGGVAEFSPAPLRPLPRTAWRVSRGIRAEAATITRTLEDTPFYARSEVAWRQDGAMVGGIHESLDLDRFRAPLVQLMLPFRMPRRSG
jgi:carotenoid 1,2-hydratase